MPHDVEKVLGREKLNEICQAYHLTAEDVKILDDILEKWDSLVFRGDDKMDVAVKALEGIPEGNRRINLISALLKINVEFALKANKNKANKRR
jgi:hypothetical protein